MADSVELVVELKDRVSRNSKAAARSLEMLARKSKSLDRTLQSHQYRAAKRAAEDKKMSKAWLVGMSAAGLAATAWGAGVAAATYVAATSLHRAGMEASKMAYAFNLLSDGNGPETMMRITKLAAGLGLEVGETANNYLRLLKLNFKPAAAEEIVKLGADMQALGASAEQVSLIVKAIGQVKGKGKLQMEELRNQIGDHGVNTSLVQDHIAKIMGIDRKTVEAAISAGKVNAEVGIQAIQAAIKEQLHESRAGEAAENFVKNTFAGDQNRMAAEAEHLGLGLGNMFRMGFEDQVTQARRLQKGGITGIFAEAGSSDFLDKFANNPMVEKLGGFIERIGAGFAMVLPQILAVGEALFEGFGEGFGFDDEAMFSAESIAAILRDDVAPAMRTVGWLVGNMIELTGFLAVGLGYMAIQSVNAGAAILSGIGSAITWLYELPGTMFDIGKNAITGFIDGIKAQWQAAKDTVASFADTIVAQTKSGFGIHSPSKEFAYLGEMSAQGFQVGLDKTTPVLPGASAMVGSDAMKGGGGSSFGNFSFAITVNGGGDAEETGRAVFAEFESNMTRFLGGMVQQAGA